MELSKLSLKELEELRKEVVNEFTRREIIEDKFMLLNKFKKSEPTIYDFIWEYYKVTEDDIKGGSRERDVLDLRYCLIAYLRYKIEVPSLKQIQKIFRLNSHPVVLRSLKKHNDYIDSDDSYKAMYIFVSRKIDSFILD